MGKKSGIEWTDASWSPWRGCTKVSAGCAHCYAERRAKRVGEDFNTIARSRTTFRDPLKWKDPLMIFVGHLSDFFHPDVPRQWRKDAMDVMFLAPQHTFLILTKRPELVNLMVQKAWWGICRNVWLGVTVENQDHVSRLSELYDIPATIKFVSAEPLLGPIDLSEHMGFIDQVIVGGESGPGFRPMRPEWAWDIRDQCIAAEVPFFFKQWSGVNPKKDPRGRKLEGKVWDEQAQAPA